MGPEVSEPSAKRITPFRSLSLDHQRPRRAHANSTGCHADEKQGRSHWHAAVKCKPEAQVLFCLSHPCGFAGCFTWSSSSVKCMAMMTCTAFVCHSTLVLETSSSSTGGDVSPGGNTTVQQLSLPPVAIGRPKVPTHS